VSISQFYTHRSFAQALPPQPAENNTKGRNMFFSLAESETPSGGVTGPLQAKSLQCSRYELYLVFS